MKGIYEKYDKLADLFITYEDKISVYKDKTDGDYFLKKISKNGEREYVENITSDGVINYDDNSFSINDSSFVAITTYNNNKIGKKRNDNVDRVSVILSYEGFGILQSFFLSRGLHQLFYKLLSEDGFSKGTLEDYDVIDSENCSVIVPVIDEFKDYLDENNQKKLDGISRVIK